MKDIVVFGAGSEGEKFLFKWEDKINISHFYDNRKSGMFHGYAITKPVYQTNTFIIVALKDYIEVRHQLVSIGYKEFKDFIPSSIYKRKMAIAYGNCHMDAIKAYLIQNEKFSSEYGLYPLPPIQNIPINFPLDEVFLHCKLFLHQAIRENNKYGTHYSSEHVIGYLNGECSVISVPNLYGLPKCFFPQLVGGEVCNVYQQYVFPFLPYHEKNVWDWLKKGESIDSIKKYITEGGVYINRDIQDAWRIFQHQLMEREQDWNVKISDFIFENYKKVKLFNDTWHIKNFLAEEIANRTLSYMGYDNKGVSSEFITPPLDTYEVYIYKDVVNALGLEYEETAIRKSTKAACGDMKIMNVDRYIEELCNFLSFVQRHQENA